MLEMVFVFCHIASANQCVERTVPTLEITELACARSAKNIGTDYTETHSDWVMTQWKCQSKDEFVATTARPEGSPVAQLNQQPDETIDKARQASDTLDETGLPDTLRKIQRETAAQMAPQIEQQIAMQREAEQGKMPGEVMPPWKPGGQTWGEWLGLGGQPLKGTAEQAAMNANLSCRDHAPAGDQNPLLGFP